MSKLIEALTILLKYGDPAYPTGCEHDELYVFIDPAIVSDTDKERLDQLGFTPRPREHAFASYRYGSA